MHVTCSYLQLRVVVLALLACHSVTCEYYASTLATTCEYRILQVSCHTLLALHLRQLHVALATGVPGLFAGRCQPERPPLARAGRAPGGGEERRKGSWRTEQRKTVVGLGSLFGLFLGL